MIKLIFLVFFGVLTPIAALVVESLTGMCRGAFFNPIPTGLHTALVAIVPIGNALLLAKTGSPEYKPSVFDVLTAVAVLAITLIYTVAFLPMIPMACIGIAYLGLGFCPLAPLTSFLVTLTLLRRILKAKRANSMVWSLGGLCSLFCFITGILWCCLGNLGTGFKGLL